MTATGWKTDAEAFERLLVDAARQDTRALAVVNDLYFLRLARFAASRGAFDPEAAANQALFDGIRSIDRMRCLEERVFRAYLYTSVINRVHNEQRVNRVPTMTLDPASHGLDVELDPAYLIASDGWFQDALDELLPDQQAVIIERFGRGSTVRETAERLDRSMDSVRHLQDRGLARLRRYVIAAGLLALIIVAVFALARLDRGQIVSVEPVDQQDPAPVDESDESGTTSDEDVSADRSNGDAPNEPVSSVAPAAWAECAVEADRCAVPEPTEVRYGAGGLYAYATVSDGIDCTNAVFGDPAPNVPKTCAYATNASGPVALELIGNQKCVDISGTKLADLDGLMQYSCQPGFSQHQWSLDRQSDGSYLIRSVHSDRCMDVGGAGLDDGEPIVQNSCDAGLISQRWFFDPLVVGDYRLRNLQSDKCVAGIVTEAADGSPLAQWTCDIAEAGPRLALIDVGP